MKMNKSTGPEKNWPLTRYVSKSFLVTVAIVLLAGGWLWYRCYRWNEIAYPRMVRHSYGMVDDIMHWRESHGKPVIPPSWETNPPAWVTNPPPQRN